MAMDEQNEVEDLLFHQVPVEVLKALHRHQTTLGNDAPMCKADIRDELRGSQASHVSRVVDELNEVGLVNVGSKKGRRKPIELTVEGEELAKLLREFSETVENKVATGL